MSLYWNPRAAKELHQALRRMAKHPGRRRIDFSTGLDTSVLYLTIKDLSVKAEVNVKVIRYALAKEEGEPGYLVAARRQPGRSGVLIHPEEAGRWIDERRKKKETKKC